MTLYISGPITGQPNYKQNFARAAEQLRAAGYDVLNPADFPHPDPQDWHQCMRYDIARMMHEAQGLALLPGWATSRGACIERTLSCALDIPVKDLETWLVS